MQFLAVLVTLQPTPAVFAALKAKQRDAAASATDFDDYEYLRDAIAERVVDRLSDILREFPLCLDLGCNAGNICRCVLLSHGRQPKTVNLSYVSAEHCVMIHGMGKCAAISVIWCRYGLLFWIC